MQGQWRLFVSALTFALSTLFAVTPSSTARAGEGEGLSLADLAGSYAGRQGGFLTLCLTSDFSSDAACEHPSSVAVQFNDTEVLQGTFSPDGKFCLTDTDVNSPVGGSKAPATVIDFVAAGSITSYNRKTGRGTTSFTLYRHTAENPVSCKGANLVKSEGVQEDSHGTQDFTVGEEPALHIDSVITSLTAVHGAYGGFVVSATLYIQHQ